MSLFFSIIDISWDELKRKMAKIYCKRIGHKNDPRCVEIQSSRRKLIVIMPKDGLPDQTCTIYVELHGTPPKAYAILHPLSCFDPDNVNTVTIARIDLFDLELHNHVVIYNRNGFHRVNLEELRNRDDVALYVLPNLNDVMKKKDTEVTKP